jgi:hypothetical protein
MNRGETFMSIVVAALVVALVAFGTPMVIDFMNGPKHRTIEPVDLSNG